MIRHGLRNTPEYQVWRGMKRRCYDPAHPAYAYYGGRGIQMCAEWRDSVVAFYEGMGPRPSPKHSIDRYPDPHGDYCPENCRWATVTEQNRNRAEFNTRVEWRGETRTIAEWIEVTALPRDSIYWRLKHGWSAERTFTEPVHYGARKGRVVSDESRSNMSKGQVRRHLRRREKQNDA